MKRILIAAAAIAIGASALSTAHAANIGVHIAVGSAPPPVRYEVIPAPRPGRVWVPGHWDWNGRHHVWNPGHWERVRHGYVYQAPAWHRSQGHWVFTRGGWVTPAHAGRYDHRYAPPERHPHYDRHGRDGDRDGIPNRYDRHPGNPWRG